MRQIILEFIKAINKRDIEKISALMTDDHLFMDSQANVVHGNEKMKQAWSGILICSRITG